jgi:hypothetical protein
MKSGDAGSSENAPSEEVSADRRSKRIHNSRSFGNQLQSVLANNTK